MFEGVIKEFDAIFEKSEPGAARFKDKRYSPVSFSGNNYHGIGQSKQEEIVFVDGGNAFLIELPGHSLQLIRIASVSLKGSKTFFKEKEEFYVLSSQKSGQTTVKVFGELGLIEERTLEPNADPAGFCQNLRKINEFRMGLKNLRKGTLVLDGTLMASNKEQRKVLTELRAQALKHESKVVALSKTTSLVTSEGRSFAATIGKEEGSWWYYPVAEIHSEFHEAEIFFVKLNDSSKHVFRAETFKDHVLSIPEIASELKSSSRDLTFPGYPYGMVLADKLARITKEETLFFEAFLLSKCRNSENLERELNSLNAHDILNRI